MDRVEYLLVDTTVEMEAQGGLRCIMPMLSAALPPQPVNLPRPLTTRILFLSPMKWQLLTPPNTTRSAGPEMKTHTE